MREGQHFSVSEENILMKQTFCRCGPITLKSRYGAKTHCPVAQTIENVAGKY
jgi:hypothetical protein